MKKFVWIFIIVCIGFFFYQFFSQTKQAENKEEEARDYIKDIVMLNQEQHRVIKKYQELVLYNNSRNKAMEALENIVLPEYEQYTKRVKKIQVNREEIKPIHQLYKETVLLQKGILDDYLKASKEKNEKAIENIGIREKEIELRFNEFENHIRQLAENYNIPVSFKKEESS
jgi:hypothetical protein